MPGDHVFVAMRIRLEPLINRLFEPSPEPAVVPADLQLSFHAATTMEQLLNFYGLPLPAELDGVAAAESLGSRLALSKVSGGVRVGALHIWPGADQEHVTVGLESRT
jgi:cell volume regulation protein A